MKEVVLVVIHGDDTFYYRDTAKLTYMVGLTSKAHLADKFILDSPLYKDALKKCQKCLTKDHFIYPDELGNISNPDPKIIKLPGVQGELFN